MRSFAPSPRLIGVLLFTMAVLCGAFHPSARGEGERPNILVILADDLGYGDLGCFGHPELRTPHLDRLAAEGLALRHCYSAAANCSPARTGLLTGRTPYRVGIYSQIPMLSPMHLPETEITVATLLREAGYATAVAGKWHLAGLFNLPGQPQPEDHGFDHWFACQNNALPNHRDPYNFVRNGVPLGPQRGYAGGLVADEAVRWLQSGRDKAKPFFLYLPFCEPHEPIASAPHHVEPYAALHPDDPSRAAYYGNVAQLDEAVGRVLGALVSEGVDGDTLVFFTSDNGPARTRWHNAGSTGGLRESKGHLHEGGIRVPGIVRWPGRVEPGSVSDEPVGGVDWLPTLCEVAGIEPPRDRVLDGVSLVPLLEGRRLERAKPLYWQFLRYAPHVAVRWGEWKMLASLDGPEPTRTTLTKTNFDLVRKAGLRDFQLYHLGRDPGETEELSAAEPSVFADLRERMEELHRSVAAEAPEWPEWEDPNYEGPRIEWPDYRALPLAQ